VIEFGYGEDPAFVKWMADRYIDLAQLIAQQSSYTDFEGFTDPEPIKAMLDDSVIVERLKGASDFVRDLLAHWMHENIDQGDYTPDNEEALQFIELVDWLFNSRFYMKVNYK